MTNRKALRTNTNKMKPVKFLECKKQGGSRIPYDFIDNQRMIYQDELMKRGISIRLGRSSDTKKIIELNDWYAKTHHTYSKASLYPLFNFGSCVILENSNREVIAYKLESTYATFGEKISFTEGMVIASEYSNKGLEEIMIGFSYLIAMEKGATSNKGIINIKDYSLVSNFVNQFGGVFTAFEPNRINNEPCLIYTIPLDEYTIYRQLDLPAIYQFLETHKAGKDYHLIGASNLDFMSHIYARTDFGIIGLLDKGFLNLEKAMYLAVKVKF